MATTADLLTEARDAYHRLQTGTAAVQVRDSDGSFISYTPANLSRLKAYIRELEIELAGCRSVQRPLRPVWG
jgi:hypothetical protein